jgi:nicotinate-nucleotide adenylyltransferase
MLRLAIDGEPKYRIDRCEIERGGPSYTIDTVHQLKRQLPGAHVFLLIGPDQFAGLHTWRRFDELLREVTLVLAQRPGANDSADARVLAAPRHVLELPTMALSSSDIRTRVAAGQAIDAMVAPEVAQYIDQHRLYRGGNGS